MNSYKLIKFIWVVALLFGTTLLVADRAQARVCYEGMISFNQSGEQEAVLQLAAYQCHTLQVVQRGLETISIGFDIGSVYAACTGYGLPVTVGLQSASIGIKGIKLIVDSLPCDNSKEEKKMVKMVRAAVCEDLNVQGIKCQL